MVTFLFGRFSFCCLVVPYDLLTGNDGDLFIIGVAFFGLEDLQPTSMLELLVTDEKHPMLPPSSEANFFFVCQKPNLIFQTMQHINIPVEDLEGDNKASSKPLETSFH